MENKYVALGPIFEPGPGWGGKIKKWIKKYLLGSDCSLCRATRYVLVFGIIILILLMPKVNEQKQSLLITENSISETVKPGDGRIHLARRVLTKYLDQNIETKLLSGQRVFIETVLREDIPNKVMRIGNEVKIETRQIEVAIEKSKLLTASQLEKWQKYAEKIRF